MMSLPHTRFDMSNRTGVLQEADTAYSSGAAESTPGFFGWVHVVHLSLVIRPQKIAVVLCYGDVGVGIGVSVFCLWTHRFPQLFFCCGDRMDLFNIF